MKLTVAEVQRVARLARLKLTTAEETSLTEQLDSILEYVSQLSEIDTTHIEPFRPTVGAVQSLREDAVTRYPEAEALLANAPDRDGTFFKVPKIIE